MSARPTQRATKPRRAALLCGAMGWVVVLALAITRIALGAPRETGVLAVLLAAGFALLATSATLFLLEALHDGFGALDSFFAAALARSAERPPPTPPQQPQPERPRRGYIGDRPFVANDDGSVVVETLLGPRLFPSLADAQDFIGS